MARAERVSSTTPVPVEQAQLIDPGAFRFSNISAQVLEQAGGVLFELGKRELKAKNSLAINAAVESRRLAELKMEEFIRNNPDPDTWDEGARKILEEQGTIYSQQRFNSQTQKEQEIEQQAFKDKLNMKVGIAAVTQNIANNITLSGKNLVDAMSNDDGTPDAAVDILELQKLYQEALEMQYTPEIAAIYMEKTLKEGQKARAEAAIEDIKPNLIAAIAERDKAEDGYKVLNVATAQLVKDGVLTETEAAEANKKLGDWIDNYVAGRIKAAKEVDKLTTIQAYQKLSKPIVNGELTYDDIDESDLRKTRRSGENVSDVEKWYKYIKGSYKKAPTKNTPEGHTVSFAAVYDVATLQLSPKEGYDVLLEARFNDRSITNEQFEWAVNRIENPYPKHVLEDLKAVLKSNLEDFNRVFSSDKERNKETNESLISWVDELFKQDKVPSFDFKKNMAAMSSAFRAGQPYDIGRIIEQGGREWEIIGFDNSGEPLVEEVP